MTLDECRPGEQLLIRAVQGLQLRAMAIRLGVAAGAEVHCQARLHRGPVILRCGDQEIAVGYGIARHILVRSLPAG